VAGPSWEGMAIENVLAVADGLAEPSFYRTSGGAEVDLVLSWPDGRESIPDPRVFPLDPG
jgi:uncharacterized protein